MISPYQGFAQGEWLSITNELIAKHPLDIDEIVVVTLDAWAAILSTKIAGRYLIGKDVLVRPQVMGNSLHEVIPLLLQDRHPGQWRRQHDKNEKDMVYTPNPAFSVEIKTSSHSRQIFGNRSYAQPTANVATGRKGKSGYYLAINFEKFSKGGNRHPQIRIIRFGWLDHSDWIAQKAPTGQQARLKPTSEKHKLRILYEG